MGPLQGASSAVVNVAGALGPLEKLASLLRSANDSEIAVEPPGSHPESAAPVRANHGFVLRGVTLPIDGAAPMQVDAGIPHRGLTLIRGPNGSVKTTLLYVLFRGSSGFPVGETDRGAPLGEAAVTVQAHAVTCPARDGGGDGRATQKSEVPGIGAAAQRMRDDVVDLDQMR